MEKEVLFDRIQSARLNRFINNFYSADVVGKADEMWESDDAFMFAYEDSGVRRLVFFSRDNHSLDELLKQIRKGPYFMEFLTRDPDEYRPADAEIVARMMRFSNTNCGTVFEEGSPVLEYMDSTDVEMAQESDVEEINGILWSTFHTEISHLLSNDELRERIREGQISIHRDDAGHIDAILQAEVMPKKFYINQVVNRTDKHVVHAILLNRLAGYVTAGGKYLYAWVEDKNTASRKFHAKYGMKHDGMWSMIYRIER